MASLTTLIYFLFLFFIAIAEGEMKRSKDKIIIHVPYKIHKHHHTHTKYKVITIPAPKKENTVIYLKEEIQPIIKHIAPAQTPTEVSEIQSKPPEPFVPPHQQSAAALLSDLTNHKEESLTHSDQQHQYSTIVDDQKPLESHFMENSNGFVPNLMYKPMLLPSHGNLIPNFSFKPSVFYPQQAFTPKLILNPIIHQSYNTYLPKFSYQPMQHIPQKQFNSQQAFKSMLPPKIIQDSVAHTSSQVYKTVVNPRQKLIPYKVKEENEEEHKKRPNPMPVPSLKFNRKAKVNLHPGRNHQFGTTTNIIHPNPEYEYEHVGYLIIDGNSRKVVGKNFKDEIRFSR